MKNKIFSLTLSVAMCVVALFGYNSIDISAYEGIIASETITYESFEETSSVDDTLFKVPEMKFESASRNSVEIDATHNIPEEAKELTIEEQIKESCDIHGIPFDITLAIARLETGWFKSKAYLEGNNPGGLSVNGVPLIFDTIEEGVERFVSNLAENYFAVGLDTPAKIGKKYCPTNPDWVDLIEEMRWYETGVE